jgi:hypothetical protein
MKRFLSSPQLINYLYDDDDDDVYLKKNYNEGVTKSNPTERCRPTKGISKRVNIQIINICH